MSQQELSSIASQPEGQRLALYRSFAEGVNTKGEDVKGAQALFEHLVEVEGATPHGTSIYCTICCRPGPAVAPSAQPRKHAKWGCKGRVGDPLFFQTVLFPQLGVSRHKPFTKALKLLFSSPLVSV